MREEEFELLAAYIEALIEEKIENALGRDTLNGSMTVEILKQDAINVIVYGEKLEG